MKTEEFDDAIRGKFNSPIPPVSEEEVDAVYRNINNRRLAKTNFHWRRYAIISLAVLLFGGLLFWNIRLNTNQQNLASEVKQLNERLDQTNAIKQEENNKYVQQETLPPATPLHLNEEIPKINKSNFSTQSAQKPASMKSESTTIPLIDKKINNSENNIVAKNNEESNSQPEIVTSKNTPDSISKSSSENNNQIVKTEESTQQPNVKKSTSKTKFNYLTGIGADLSVPFTGINLLEEVQFGKHWSITSGLRYLTFGDELFENEEEYNEKSHEEFKERFRAHIVDSMEIDEIEIHDQFFQIPLLLNYRFPIKNGFAMLISTGGDISLYYKRKVEFVSRPKTPSNFETPVALVEKPEFKIIHDIRIGIGIQKHWNRYSIQFIPEVVYLFHPPNVMIKPINPSIRIGAYYRI